MKNSKEVVVLEKQKSTINPEKNRTPILKSFHYSKRVDVINQNNVNYLRRIVNRPSVKENVYDDEFEALHEFDN